MVDNIFNYYWFYDLNSSKTFVENCTVKNSQHKMLLNKDDIFSTCVIINY